MRALIIVLDSAGIGGAPDAAEYGDDGANTLGHIFEHAPDLRLPNLFSLGLPELLKIERGGLVTQGQLCSDERAVRRQRHHHRALGTRGCNTRSTVRNVRTFPR